MTRALATLAYAPSDRLNTLLHTVSAGAALAEILVVLLALVAAPLLHLALNRPESPHQLPGMIFRSCEILLFSPAIVIGGLAATGAALTAAAWAGRRSLSRTGVVLLVTHLAAGAASIGTLLTAA